MPSPHRQKGKRAGTPESSASDPAAATAAAATAQDVTNTSQPQDQQIIDIGFNHGLSQLHLSPAQRQQTRLQRRRKKYDAVRRKQVADKRKAGACPPCKARKVRCFHDSPTTKSAQKSDVENAAAVKNDEPRVQNVAPIFTQLRQHQARHRISKTQYARSEASPIPSLTGSNAYYSEGSSISTEMGATELDRTNTYVPGHVPSMVHRYVNQNEVQNTVNERLFANSSDRDVTWSRLASVDERRLVWTRDEMSVMGDSGIDMGSELGGDARARDAKLNSYLHPIQGQEDLGIDMGSELCGDARARDAKLNSYLHPIQGQEELAVFIGGPRRRQIYENMPFDRWTLDQRTQPRRLDRTDDSQPPPAITGLVGDISTQNFTPPPVPSQMFIPLVRHSGGIADQTFTSPPPTQIFSPPTRQFDTMTIQDYPSQPLQSHQMFNSPENRSPFPFYASPSPQTISRPQNATPYSSGFNEQENWAPPESPYGVPKQQIVPGHYAADTPLWDQNLASSFPSTQWPRLDDVLSEDIHQELSTMRGLMLGQSPNIQPTPAYPYDPDNIPPQQGSWSNPGMPSQNSMIGPASVFSYDTQYIDSNMLLLAHDNRALRQPISQEDFYPHVSSTINSIAFPQPLSQDDQFSSAPSLSYGQSSAETASTPFDTSCNQSRPSLTPYEPVTYAHRPAFPYPPDTVRGVAGPRASPSQAFLYPPNTQIGAAAAITDYLEAEHGDLAKGLFDDIDWNEVHYSMPE